MPASPTSPPNPPVAGLAHGLAHGLACSLIATGAVLMLVSGTAQADSRPVETELEPAIVIIGNRIRLDTIPGSATVLDQSVLAESHVFTVNEALRKVPGVFARDEEGIGLRPNLGLRGLNPTRSSKVLLLEDGIPLAYAPYGDNATYYHPPIERFSSIEILKGAGQILYGPHTVGGVINYVTPAIPSEAGGQLRAAVGSREFREMHAQYGMDLGRTGFIVHGTTKTSDGARENMDFNITDVNAKVVHELSERQQLTLRGSFYDENSQVTYSGLTLAEWRADPFQNAFADDHMYARRWSTSATHRLELNAAAALTTNLYYTNFSRDWWRQSSNSAQRPNDRSDPACAGMVNLTTTCGNEGRLRDYWTAGIEPRLTLQHAWLGIDGTLDAGMRLHREYQHRIQANGDTPRARRAGVGPNAGIKEDSERTVEAVSAFVQNRFEFGRITLTPGLRYEHVAYERTNNLTGQTGRATIRQFVPGVGATFKAGSYTTVFAGVHRGFAPPGVADIVTPAGGSVNLDAELSWNYELGLRSEPRDGLSLETALFRMDFANQIVPASVAGGSGATLTSAGKTLQQGLELAAQIESSAFVDWSTELYARLSYTWLTDAKFVAQRYSSVAGFADVKVTGNRLPYAPEHLLAATVGVRLPWQLSLELEGVYTSAAYTDDLNSVAVVANGQRGRMPGYTVFNLAANYDLDMCACRAFVAVKNLTDELYVADMSRGMIPGMPRLVQLGLELRL